MKSYFYKASIYWRAHNIFAGVSAICWQKSLLLWRLILYIFNAIYEQKVLILLQEVFSYEKCLLVILIDDSHLPDAWKKNCTFEIIPTLLWKLLKCIQMYTSREVSDVSNNNFVIKGGYSLFDDNYNNRFLAYQMYETHFCK